MKRLITVLACSLLMVNIARAELAMEPGQVLDTFHEAAAVADLDTYLGLLTDEMVFLGTDGSERWQGQTFRDFVDKNFNAGRGWRYVPEHRSLSLSADGQMAWFDEMLRNDALGQCRGSGVLVKTNDGWKVAQYNLSVPVPNEMVMQVVADISTLEGNPAPITAVTPGETDSHTAAPVAAQDTSNATAKSTDCSRKRHKTNRKAGC